MSEQVAPKRKSKPKPPAPKSDEKKCLEDLFKTLRAEGWSDAEIELGVAGQ